MHSLDKFDALIIISCLLLQYRSIFNNDLDYVWRLCLHFAAPEEALPVINADLAGDRLNWWNLWLYLLRKCQWDKSKLIINVWFISRQSWSQNSHFKSYHAGLVITIVETLVYDMEEDFFKIPSSIRVLGIPLKHKLNMIDARNHCSAIKVIWKDWWVNVIEWIVILVSQGPSVLDQCFVCCTCILSIEEEFEWDGHVELHVLVQGLTTAVRWCPPSVHSVGEIVDRFVIIRGHLMDWNLQLEWPNSIAITILI